MNRDTSPARSVASDRSYSPDPDQQASSRSPPPTGPEDDIEQVRAANTPYSRRSSKAQESGSTGRRDKSPSERSQSAYSDDFDNEDAVNKPSEKPAENRSQSKDTSSNSSTRKEPRQNNNNKKNSNSKPQTYEKRLPQFTWSDRPKTAMYDPASQKFRPDPKPISEEDLQLSVDRLSEPRKRNPRDMPPIEPSDAKTYTGKGLKSVEVEAMLDRLTTYDKEKGPSDSRRITTEDHKVKKGLMHSFAWTGRW